VIKSGSVEHELRHLDQLDRRIVVAQRAAELRKGYGRIKAKDVAFTLKSAFAILAALLPN